MEKQATSEAWVTLPRAEEMPPQQGGYNFGFVPNMRRLIASHPQIGQKFSALFGQIMFQPGKLERREREMVAGVAAAAQDCYY